MGSSARPLGAKSGIRVGTPSSIVTATSTTWTVQPFGGVLDGEAAAVAGPYSYAFDTNQTGAVTAAAGSSRIDRLDVQVSDPAESDGSSTPAVTVVYTAGVAGSGVAAAAPPRSHRVCLLNVPASGGGSPTVSWAPDWSGDPGEWTFNTVAERDAYVTAIGSANVPVNQRATVLSGATMPNVDYVWTSGWNQLPGGLLIPTSVSGGTLNADGSITVTGSRLNLDGLLSQANAVRIEGVISTGSNQIIYARLRAAGSDVTTNHAEQFSYAAASTGGGTPSAIQNPNIGNTGWQIGAISAVWQSLNFVIRQGGQALPTIGRCDVDSYASLTSMGNSTASVFQADSSARDGIGISAGSITGTTAMSGTIWCHAIV